VFVVLVQRDSRCCNGLKSVNGRVVCTYLCCAGLTEISFDNGRFSSVDCTPAAHQDDDDEYTDYDDDDDTEYDEHSSDLDEG